MSSNHKEKNSSDRKPREEIARAVTEKTREGQLTCAAAHAIAERMKVAPEEVGFTADVLGAKIAKCQLGLFGYGSQKKKISPAPEILPALKEAIESAVVNGRLGCDAAWKIADELKLKRMEVSSACEAMKIKISACQLGAF
jgi:hypothetical protein